MSLIENARVGFDYSILEEMEAGLELLGIEVKSLRAGQGSLKGSRVVARGGEAYLVGASIPAWQIANAPKSYNPERTRRLLLSKKEIARIASAEGEKGLTIVPIRVYNSGRKLKLSVAVARGKKKEDKRQTIRAREEKRRIERTLKTKYKIFFSLSAFSFFFFFFFFFVFFCFFFFFLFFARRAGRATLRGGDWL